MGNKKEVAQEVPVQEQLTLENLKTIPREKIAITDYIVALINEINNLKQQLKK